MRRKCTRYPDPLTTGMRIRTSTGTARIEGFAVDEDGDYDPRVSVVAALDDDDFVSHTDGTLYADIPVDDLRLRDVVTTH